MNKNLDNAILDIAKADALMYAMERAFIGVPVESGDSEMANHAENAFYALWDAIRKVSDDLDLLAEDATVVNAVYAVNNVRRNLDSNEER